VRVLQQQARYRWVGSEQGDRIPRAKSSMMMMMMMNSF
jgi:hypothetical protein